MELYLIRHGQSTNNALGTPQGRSKDPGLTALGFRQADAVAAHLADGVCPDCLWEQRSGYNLDRLYCSAMYRAMLTARPIGQALGLNPEVLDDIHEQGGIYLDEREGQRVGYPGMTRSAILAEFPGYVLPDTVTENGWWNRDYESVAAATGRAINVAERLIREGKTSSARIALVTHNFFANLLIKALFNQLPGLSMFYYHYNTAITRIDINPDGFLGLRYLNRTNHLTADLITF
jgi:broad specificity phosphatase PhoE